MTDSEARYLVWSNEHRGWWRHGGWGYTPDLSRAGRFSRANALAICRGAIPSAAHLGLIAEIPVRETDMQDFLEGQMVPAAIISGIKWQKQEEGS